MPKKRIVVFDFIPGDCVHTAAAIREWYGAQNADVKEFTDMQDFVYDFKSCLDSGIKYDIAFICADDMMGVETARNIREMDAWCPMFLVSTVDDFGIEGFRLHVLDYLIKPVSPDRVGHAVRRIGAPSQAGSQHP